MILCNDTLKLLKNLASINSGMNFKQGNVLRTISNASTIVAVASIEENIPRDFSLYDLNSLLATISMVEKPDIEFWADSLKITTDIGVFEHFYCGDKLIRNCPDKEITTTPVYSFDVSSEELGVIFKAASVTKATSLSVYCGDDGSVILKAHQKESKTSNCYKKVVGNYDGHFNVNVSIDNLKVIPEDYTVSVELTKTSKPLIKFKSKVRNLQYWIGCELDSKVSV